MGRVHCSSFTLFLASFLASAKLYVVYVTISLRTRTCTYAAVAKIRFDSRFDSTSRTLIPFYVGSTHEELVDYRDQFTYATRAFGAQPANHSFFITWLVRRIAATTEADNFVTTTE